MTVILSDSTEQNKDEQEPVFTYLIDEHESTALDDVFDGLFSEVLKQLSL